MKVAEKTIHPAQLEKSAEEKEKILKTQTESGTDAKTDEAGTRVLTDEAGADIRTDEATIDIEEEANIDIDAEEASIDIETEEAPIDPETETAFIQPIAVTPSPETQEEGKESTKGSIMEEDSSAKASEHSRKRLDKMKKQKLCKLVKNDALKKHPEEYQELVSDAAYVCLKCGRAAKDKASLCRPSLMKKRKKDHKCK